MIFSFNTVCLVILRDGDITHRTVIHIHASLPDHIVWIDVQWIALINAVIKHRSNQIVAACDGVHVAGKVKVDRFHWNYLCISAAGSATF